MVQALLEKKRRDKGTLIQFNSIGKDGAREATWTQPSNHPSYLRPINESVDCPKEWVFQVKYYDIGLKGWKDIRTSIISDLDNELKKVTEKHRVPCHHYVLIVNVPLTGARNVGTRDCITKKALEWESVIPEIDIWDASDLSRMLDNSADVRTGISELILPGDVIHAVYRNQITKKDRTQKIIKGYLNYLVDSESKARAEEAGDDDSLPLSKVYIDQTLSPDRNNIPEFYNEIFETWKSASDGLHCENDILPVDLDLTPSSFPLLWGEQNRIMLLAGPGYGKSTITQFLTLYHACRLVNPQKAIKLAQRLKLPDEWDGSKLDSICTLRFPFRIELRRYAKWRSDQVHDLSNPGLALYIAKQLIGSAVESNLDQDDIFEALSNNPSLLILDGLDEVPNKEDRDSILNDFDSFLYRCVGDEVNIQIIMSSRPQGYNGEFDRFDPFRWVINELSQDDFSAYCEAWLNERIFKIEEREEAKDRISRGLSSESIKRLASTLLQATVMLTIVRKKSDIPEERYKLFEKYVDVVFEREKSKSSLISQFETELRHLHEVVGYHIHESVAQGGVSVLPKEQFREMVNQVWIHFHGDKQFNGVLNHQIQKILELATDRLVFLSGKGANQSDMDFVIQSFREYFAASYLFNHERATVESVLKCLVKHGAYWQQVLKFYSAFNAPPQRANWILNSILVSNTDNYDSDRLFDMQKRRAIIYSLPEFSRLNYDLFKKTISGCIPETEWWSWCHQDWLLNVLCGLNFGTAWEVLWRSFINSKSHPYGSECFAITFFHKAIPKGTVSFKELLKYLESSLQSKELAPLIVETVVLNNLDVGLSSANIEECSASVESIPYNSGMASKESVSNLLNILPNEYLLRIYCTVSHFSQISSNRKDVWGFLGIPVVHDRNPSIDHSNTLSILKPSWLEFKVSGQEILDLSNDSNLNDPYFNYLYSLYLALQNPENEKLYTSVVEKEKLLPTKVIWSLKPSFVLGPVPSDFGSISDWNYFKKEVRDTFDDRKSVEDLENIASKFSSDDFSNDWTIFIFHSNHWHLLPEYGILSEERITEIENSKWGKACKLSTKHFEIHFAITYNHNTKRIDGTPIQSILDMAVDLLVQGKLVDASNTCSILELCDPINISSHYFNIILDKVMFQKNIPKSWASIFLLFAIRIPGIDPEKLLCFWDEVNLQNGDKLWMPLYDIGPSENLYNLFSALLSIGSISSIDLARKFSYILRDYPGFSDKGINQIAAMKMRNCSLSDKEYGIALKCLLNSTRTIEEIPLYSDFVLHENIKRSDHYYIFYRRLISRIKTLPDDMTENDISIIEETYDAIIRDKFQYDPMISSAALDAKIQLNFQKEKPLTQLDWESVCDG